MTVLRALIEARNLIDKGWCQNSFATDKVGIKVGVFSDRACCFCMEGALMKVSTHDFDFSREDGAYDVLVKTLRELTNAHSLPTYNDRMLVTKRDVLFIYDQAIQQAEERGL